MGFGSLGENPKTIGGIGRAGAISGIPEIDRALAKLEKKFNKKVMKKAMRKTTAMFRKEVRKRTPKGRTGNLRKSVTTDLSVKKQGRFIFGRVYFGRTKGRKGYHANWLEYGTDERIIKDYRGLKKRGYRIRAKRQNVGRVKAAKMADEGLDVGTPQAIRTFRRALVKELRKIRAAN